MTEWLAYSDTYVSRQHVLGSPQVDLVQRNGKICDPFVGFPYFLPLTESFQGLEHQSHDEALTDP